MEMRLLGRTGVRVSKLCLGTMSFGGEANESESAAMYAAGRNSGINFIDCADIYNKGESEKIVGKLIREHRNEVVLATKGYFPTGNSPNARGSSRFHLVRAVEESLKRLQTDRIDLYYLHRYDDLTSLEDTLRTLDDLVRAGKILYPAVSNFSAWQAAKALGVCERLKFAPITAFQPMYNLVKRQAEVEILPFCHAESLACVPYSPVAAGLLSGKYGGQTKPASGRLVDNAMYKKRYDQTQNSGVAERFTSYAKKKDVHPVTLAVAWVASHPAVTAPIIAGRNITQLKASLEAADLDVSEFREEISSLSQAPPRATDRAEEGSAHQLAAR